jgi:hypothetical protein
VVHEKEEIVGFAEGNGFDGEDSRRIGIVFPDGFAKGNDLPDYIEPKVRSKSTTTTKGGGLNG